MHSNYHQMFHRWVVQIWLNLISDHAWLLIPLHEVWYNVCQQYFSSLETLPPNLWDFYPTRLHEFGSCLVTCSSAIEVLGSPSISWAPMGGDHALRLPKTGVCRWQVQRQYTIVRLPEIHYTASGFFLKIFDRLCVFVLVSFWSFFCESHIMKSRKKKNNKKT